MKTFKNIVIANIVILSFIGACATYAMFSFDPESELLDDLERLAVANNQLRAQRDKLQDSVDVLSDMIEKNSVIWQHKRALLEIQQNPDNYKDAGK